MKVLLLLIIFTILCTCTKDDDKDNTLKVLFVSELGQDIDHVKKSIHLYFQING